jgi:nucleoside 2-deoxyribosyltransferase
MSRCKLYLAGPEVFRPDAYAEGERLMALCEAAGMQGLYPLQIEGEPTSGQIRRRCIALIDEADALVANISPFRGSHMDPGTAFEIGYAEAVGKPVFLWSGDTRVMAERIPAAPGQKGRDAEGWLIEDFGKTENLMIVPDGAQVFPSAEAAIAEASRVLAHTTLNRRLQRQTRRSVLIAVLISLAAALSAGFVLDWLFSR